MSDVAFWLIGGGGSFVIAFITFWMMLSSRITNAENKAVQAAEDTKSASNMASVALAKIELLARDINEQRVETTSRISSLDAVTRSTSSTLVQAETRLAKSIEDIGRKLDNLGETVIRAIAELVHNKRRED